MSGADDLRAARESRAGAAERADRRGLGEAMTRMVNAAVYRATHGVAPRVVPAPRRSAAGERPVALGPGFRSAMAVAGSRIDGLDLSEVRVRDGVVRYLDVGAGPAVLLVHGIFGGTDAVLRQLGPLLPEGFRLIVPSRFGYLGSTLSARATPRRQADTFADLLDALAVDRVVVVAVSAGSTSALQLAVRHRGRVSGLVLVSANGPGPQHGRRLMSYRVARVVWGSDRFMWMVRRYFPGRLTGLMGVRAPGVGDRVRVEGELDGIFPVARRVAGAVFDAYVSNPDINDYDLRSVVAPTLIVHARDDTLAPYQGAVGLAETIPGARLLTVESGGHLLLGDHPEITRAVANLLTSTREKEVGR